MSNYRLGLCLLSVHKGLVLCLLLVLWATAAGAQSLFPVLVNGKWGYIGEDGRIELRPRYIAALPFSEGVAWVQEHPDRGWSIIDTRGRVLREQRNVAQASDFRYGFAVVRNAPGLLGLIDKDGWLALPFDYEQITYLDSTFIVCSREGLYRVYNLRTKAFVIGLFESVFPPYNGLFVAKKNGSWGVIDTAGQAVVQFIYQNMLPFREDLAWFRENGLWGVLNTRGEVLMTAQFDRTTYGFVNGFADVRVGPFEGLINRSGFVVLPPEYQAVGHFSQGRAWFKLGPTCGFIDTTGNIVIPAIYEDVAGFSEGRARVGREGKYGYIDLQGREVTGCIYQSGTDFRNGYAIVRQEGKSGVIDSAGVTRLPIKYDAVEYLASPNTFRLRLNGLYGIVDTAGNEVLPTSYSRIDVLDSLKLYFVVTQQMESGIWKFGRENPVHRLQGVAQFRPTPTGGWLSLAVNTDTIWHQPTPDAPDPTALIYKRFVTWPGYSCAWLSKAPLQNTTGGSLLFETELWETDPDAPGPWTLLPLGYGTTPDESRTFDEVSPFMPPSQFRVRIGSKWGVFDASQKAFVLEPTYDFLGERSANGYVVARDAETYGILSCYTGQWVVPAENAFLFPMGSNVYEVGILKQDLYGEVHSFSTLRNLNGNTLLDRVYDLVGQFVNGLAPISIEGKWGYIDSTGSVFLPPRYEDARPFSGGYAAVRSDQKWGFIDQSGSLATTYQYDNAGDFAENCAPVESGGHWGFVSPLGDTVISFLFEAAEPFRDSLAAVKLRGRWGLINHSGVLVQEPLYDRIDYIGNGLYRVGALTQTVPQELPRGTQRYRYGVVQAPSGEMVVPCSMLWISEPVGNQVGYVRNVDRPSIGYAHWNGGWLWEPRK